MSSRSYSDIFITWLWLWLGLFPALLSAGELQVVSADSRVDLIWAQERGVKGYHIYRCATINGAYQRLNSSPHPVEVYSDWLGRDANGKQFFYKVTALLKKGGVLPVNALAVTASPFAMNDDQFLSSIQQATFRYFWNYAHEDSGLVRERYYAPWGACASGGTGFGVLAVMIGVERGFITREQGVERLLKITKFLEAADRFHGVWPHWINGQTGGVICFSGDDDGGDIVETALLMQGLLTVRQYFNGENRSEAELRDIITRLWHTVEWNWYLKDKESGVMYWHWSPNFGWKKNHRICGYNECMIVYLLGIASPTHPIPASTWQSGWAGGTRYVNGREYYGIKQAVGPPMGGPLFLSQYSFIGFDPRHKRDQYADYFDNARAVSLIHREYCRDNPQGFKGYSERVWGLTACDGPDGYSAFAPGSERDNGTVAPTAAIGSFPFTPSESMAALKYFYYEMGDRLWGPFGFYDAFNEQRSWVARSHIAIDQGPIICMIENARTGLCWKNFMQNPEIQPMLDKIGFVKD